MVVGEEGPLKSSTSDFMHEWSYQTPSRNGGGGSGRSLRAGRSFWEGAGRRVEPKGSPSTNLLCGLRQVLAFCFLSRA